MNAKLLASQLSGRLPVNVPVSVPAGVKRPWKLDGRFASLKLPLAAMNSPTFAGPTLKLPPPAAHSIDTLNHWMTRPDGVTVSDTVPVPPGTVTVPLQSPGRTATRLAGANRQVRRFEVQPQPFGSLVGAGSDSVAARRPSSRPSHSRSNGAPIPTRIIISFARQLIRTTGSAPGPMYVARGYEYASVGARWPGQ